MIKKITRFTKIIVISLFLIIAAFSITVGLVYYLYPEESVLEIVKNRAETLLERRIEIGSLNYSLKGIVIRNISIYDKNPDNSETLLVKSEEAVITFSLLSIIKKDFKLKTIFFNNLQINWIFDNKQDSNLGRLLTDLKNKSDSGGDKNIQLSKIILNVCKLRLVNPPPKYIPLEGEYILDGTININENNQLSIYDSRLTLPQRRGILYPELNVETSDLFKITGKVKLESASLLWVYRFAQKDPQLPFETVNGQVNNFEITRDHVKGSAKATSTLKNVKSILHADGECVVDLNSLNVYLKNIQGKINTSSVTLDNMLIETQPNGAVKKYGFSNINFQLGDLRGLLSSLPQALSGSIHGSFSYDGKYYNGKVDLSDCSYKGRTELFNGLNTSLDIRNNVFRKENVRLSILGSSSIASVTTTDSNFKNFYIQISSEKLNLNNIQFKKNGNGSEPGDTTSSPIKFNIPINIAGKITVKELLYNDFIFKNTNANIALSESILKVNNLNTSVLSGSIAGTGTIDISGDFPKVQTSLKFNNIKIQDVKFDNEKMNSRFFGFADGNANLNLVIKENATDTITGNAIFSITKGKVVNTGVQDGLILFLSELRYKLKDLEFNKIYGNVEISGSYFNVNSFIFNSEDIRLSMAGRIDKDLNAKDVKMKLEFNNHFIKDVPRPALAVFNEYASGKWYVIPFSLNGMITESKNIKMLKKNQ